MPMFLLVCTYTEGEDKLIFSPNALVFCLAESGNSVSHWLRAHKVIQAVCLDHHLPGGCLALQPPPMNTCIKPYLF